MTDLGKVFVVIVTVLSASFLVLAMVVNATHVNYRDKADKLATENSRLQSNVAELKSAVQRGQTELAQEQAARRSALAALQTQIGSISGVLATNEAQLRALQSQNTEQNQALSQTQDELLRVTSENTNIRNQINTTLEDRNDLRSKIINRTDELYNFQSMFKDAEARNSNLQDQVTLLQARNTTASATLAAAGLPEDPEDVPPANVKGVVTAVSGNNLVEISLGRDDGLRPGHQLEVYRGNQYLGKIRIQRVSDDKAVGEIIPNFRRGFIQQNDTVAATVG